MMRIDGWAIFELYRWLPTWFRVTLGVGLIVAGFALAWTSHHHYLAAGAEEQRTGKQKHPLADRSDRNGFQSGLFLTLGGCIVVLTSARSRSEANGYRF